MRDFGASIQRAEVLSERGRYAEARRIFNHLSRHTNLSGEEQARVELDLAVIAATSGHSWSARLHAHRSTRHSTAGMPEFALPAFESVIQDGETSPRVKVAIVSLLFNWPSTGGGTVHTKELADFLTRDGYDVCHFYAVNEDFQVGQVTEPLPYLAEPLEFHDREWRADVIRDRFYRAVSAFDPDWVIVTDSWSTKPLLAEAVCDYPYFLRIAAQECLCPLNNVRMLVEPRDDPSAPLRIVQCDQNQLDSPSACSDCVRDNSPLSGGLHKAERILGGFHEPEYRHRLRQAFAECEGVLAVNPQIAALFEPHAPAVHVVPSGFDPLRFPIEYRLPPARIDGKVRFLFAGLTSEFMKGFFVLREAVQKLRQHRDNFEVWATGSAADDVPVDGVRFIGWQSQAELTHAMATCDALIFPTVAQEALGRSAVEALGCGRPVIASRIGGLDWVIEHERNGLLFTPGDADELALQIERLIDDPDRRERLGRAGFQKFQREFTWESILARHYRPLFGPANKSSLETATLSEVNV